MDFGVSPTPRHPPLVSCVVELCYCGLAFCFDFFKRRKERKDVWGKECDHRGVGRYGRKEKGLTLNDYKGRRRRRKDEHALKSVGIVSMLIATRLVINCLSRHMPKKPNSGK